MSKKLNKKILNLIGLYSGITATIAVGVGGIIYSLEDKVPTKLEIKGNNIRDISGNVNRSLASFRLSDHIYTDLGKQITSGLFFSVIDGSLPNGLEIDETTGVIFGTPTTTESVNLRIKVTANVDGINLQGYSSSFNINISEQLPSNLVFKNIQINSITGNVGTSIISSPDLTNNVYTDLGEHITSDLQFSLIGHELPAGLNFNFRTGVISGDPKSLTLTEYTYKIQVTSTVGIQNLSGETNEFTLKIDPRIQEDLEIRKPISNVIYNINEDFTSTPDLSDSVYTSVQGKQITSNLNFSLSEGYTLQTGLQINQQTGVISGRTTEIKKCPCKIKVSTQFPDGSVFYGETDEFYILSTDGVLPDEVYNIDESNTLHGFTQEFIDNIDEYSHCDTMIIPKEVNEIYNYAFGVCNETSIPSYIKKIDLSQCNNLQAISYGSFTNSPNVEIILPTSIREIEGSAFINAKITSIKFPDSLTKIQTYAFYGCSSLTTVDLSNCSSLTSIDANAFYRCSSITSISLPGNLTTIGQYAFANCSSITSITFPEGNNGKYGLAVNLGDNAQIVVQKSSDDKYEWDNNNGVTGCLACGNIAFTDDLTAINDEAFLGCSSITSISFPNTLTSIGKSAFSSCYSLTSVDLSNCNSLTSIKYSTFGSCSSITSISFPNNLTSIDGNAFYGCSSITSISFPSSLYEINDYAFAYCSNLNKITWIGLNSSPLIRQKSFAYLSHGGTVSITGGDGSYTSSQLLSALCTFGSLYSDWTAE